MKDVKNFVERWQGRGDEKSAPGEIAAMEAGEVWAG